jgi:peptide/nickel transport system substrate-binding protein
MNRVTVRRLLALAGVVIILAPAACGTSARPTGPNRGLRPVATGAGEDLFDGTRGGMLTVYDHSDFQHFDPGEAYYSIDYEVIYATQRPLYSYLPNQTQTLSPDLASGPPIISADGKTVTVHLKRGVRFSPPVNREVTSADVAYAIERGANPHVSNPYFALYFDDIVGASKATGGPISGIVTPNRYTIVFHLTGPYGTFFAGALSLPLTAPVPREFAARYDAQTPTAYGNYLVSTGPYMVKSAPNGRVLGIGYVPGRSATLVRNPNWNPATDTRPAYLDRIEINIGGDPDVIGHQVLEGSHAVQNDSPAAAIVKLAYQHYPSQLIAVPGAGTYYVAVNNKQGPFSNVNARKALWAALDRTAMIQANGGPVAGQLATHFIYPGTMGYEQAGGDAGPRVDYNEYPVGNMALAAKYMKLAGYPTGKYTGHATIQIVGASGDPNSATAEIVNQTLLNLGYKTNFTLVDMAVMYSKYCSLPAQEIDVCPNVSFVRDFADPQTMLDPTFAGYNILSSNNSNFGQVNNPHINASMKTAERTLGAKARAEAWANIDRMLVSTAAAIPWMFARQPNIESHNVRGINDLWDAGEWDYAYTSLK